MAGSLLHRRSDAPRLGLRHVALILALFAAAVRPVATGGHDDQADTVDRGDTPGWGMIGNDPANSRNQRSEHHIRPSNVGQLSPKWVAATAGDVSATPAVVGDAVYFGDFGGTLWKLDARTGQVVWQHLVSDYTGIAGDLARTSPIVKGDLLIVGDLRHPNLLGINARTGELRWNTQVHPDPKGIMTGSPVLSGDVVFTGVSASGASAPATATFRGSIVAVHARTGRILWQSYSLPDNGGLPGGYAGSTMFAPPAVDEEAGLVYGTFGQAYREPAAITACHKGGFIESCEEPGSYLKSIVAFDTKTGKPRWSYRVQGHDPWLRACGHQPGAVTWCAAESDGEKWDLGGSGVNVMRVKIKGHWRNVVGLGEKSGVYIVLDAKTGQFIWNTLVGPGGDQGGVEWGTAFDGERIYVPITNHHHIPYHLTENGVLLNTPAVTGGSWAALDPSTGKILWQTADPQVETVPGFPGSVGVWDLAPLTVANGIVYASSMAKLASQNQMFALDAETGKILWEFGAGSSVNSGPAVAKGAVYWGTGYSRSGVEGSGNTKLYAFSINGK